MSRKVLSDRFGLNDYFTIFGISRCVVMRLCASLRSSFVNRMVAVRPSLSKNTGTPSAKAYGTVNNHFSIHQEAAKDAILAACSFFIAFSFRI